jgi:hypothetical protein
MRLDNCSGFCCGVDPVAVGVGPPGEDAVVVTGVVVVVEEVVVSVVAGDVDVVVAALTAGTPVVGTSPGDILQHRLSHDLTIINIAADSRDGKLT